MGFRSGGQFVRGVDEAARFLCLRFIFRACGVCE